MSSEFRDLSVNLLSSFFRPSSLTRIPREAAYMSTRSAATIYVRTNPQTVLASVPYDVTPVIATIDGPASVTSGARFEVAWSGPNNRGDWVTIVPSGAAAQAYASYVDARSGRADAKTSRSMATLNAPTQPGLAGSASPPITTSVQTSSQGHLSVQQRVDLTASRSTLQWELQDLTCYFSNLVISDAQ